MEIAIDFDGTIVKNKWPEIGKMRWLASSVLKWLARRHTLILNTCREGAYLKDAVLFLKVKGIKFLYFNENTRERIREYGGDCRKIAADLYLDDKAFFPGWWVIPLVVIWREWREMRCSKLAFIPCRSPHGRRPHLKKG